MALFNKLFSTRKRTIVKCQDVACEKLFSFTSDQVRVAVFRECDFRGRKLLFDSHSVEKILLTPGDEQQVKRDSRKFVEIKNEHGYMYTKPNSDVGQLGEMIFGSVAMSYRGTTFKIHKTLTKLICSEVFPSPRNPKLRSSAPSHMQVHASTNSSLEQSVQLEDSGASSGTCSDQSVNSTSSDTLLVCKRVRSVPLDVPITGSFVSSSGYGEQSGSSIASGPQSIPIDPQSIPMDLINQGNNTSYSVSSLKRAILRHALPSPDQSNQSLTSDDSLPRPRGKTTKIGLAVIIEISNQNDLLEEVLMEHSALLDSLLWRVRAGVENAYIRHHNFVSLMFDLAADTAKWFVDLLSGSQLAHNVWQELSSSSSSYSSPSVCCDSLFSIKCCCDGFSGERTSTGIKKGFRSELLMGEDYSFLNISRFLRGDSGKKENTLAETFLKELCELLETVDTKNTNFFISTLVTAVLTHHLGWVSTVLAEENDKNVCANPLWTQLTDLYGAVGHPTKMSHTIITGNPSKTELITKILNVLTYFIRSTSVNKKNLTRLDVENENRDVDVICKLNSCIPKENYKKYEDHLREINAERHIVRGLGMKKTKTCSNLNMLSKQEEFVKGGGEIFEKVTSLGFQAISPAVDTENFDFKAFALSEEQQKLNDINEAKQHIGRFFSPKKTKTEFNIKPEDLENKNVVFVLGDNEKLVGLKQSKSFDLSSKRPNELNLNVGGKFFVDPDSSPEDFSADQKTFFNDNDFHEYKNTPIKPSTSYTLLNSPKKFNIGRAQSEPPEPQNVPKPQTPKYRYSGVKFNFQQYPQIAENYLKGKNIELSNLQNFSEKDFNFPKYDFSNLTKEPLQTPSNATELKELANTTYFEEGLEPLQTPSNASELEFTSDLICVKLEKAKEQIERVSKKEFVRVIRKDTVIKEPSKEQNGTIQDDIKKLKIVEFPMPKSEELSHSGHSFNFNTSLMRGCADHYVSDMVLQGTSAPKAQWESALKRDLVSSARHSLLNTPVEEAIAIVANTDTWEVHVMSSHTYVIDRRSSGVIVGMSQLVANMLESLLHLWRLHTPAEFCLMHIEQRLQEFCLRSKAMAQLLLETDCCSMDLLTSSLKLEVNDIPLLMAIASTHSPQVTQKYGICIQ